MNSSYQQLYDSPLQVRSRALCLAFAILSHYRETHDECDYITTECRTLVAHIMQMERTQTAGTHWHHVRCCSTTTTPVSYTYTLWGVKPHCIGMPKNRETHMFSIHMIFQSHIYLCERVLCDFRTRHSNYSPSACSLSLFSFHLLLTPVYSGSRCVRKIIMYGV